MDLEHIKFAQGNDSIHKRLNIAAGIQVIEKVFHTHNVNAYHSRLKFWMDVPTMRPPSI